MIGIFGEKQVTNLLILSQVVLSFQLPFAVVPLVMFTSDHRKMGEFVNRRWVTVTAWVMGGTIIVLNLLLLGLTLCEWL